MEGRRRERTAARLIPLLLSDYSALEEAEAGTMASCPDYPGATGIYEVQSNRSGIATWLIAVKITDFPQMALFRLCSIVAADMFSQKTPPKGKPARPEMACSAGFLGITNVDQIAEDAMRSVYGGGRLNFSIHSLDARAAFARRASTSRSSA